MTGPNPRLASAEAIGEHRLAVVFSDGTHGTFDVGPYLVYPAFAALRDAAFFRRAHAAHGTVAWSDEVDLCPDTVWTDSEKVPREPMPHPT
jgi:hypothetical protein